jgi:hypothetical protein
MSVSTGEADGDVMHARREQPTAAPASPFAGTQPIVLFDPAVADEAVVEQVDGKWVLTVRRYTGDVLAKSPLHVSGDFQTAVVKLATRLLRRWNVADSAATGWVEHRGTWVCAVHPYDPAANPVKL